MFVDSVAEFSSCANSFPAKSVANVKATAVSNCVHSGAYFFSSMGFALIFIASFLPTLCQILFAQQKQSMTANRNSYDSAPRPWSVERHDACERHHCHASTRTRRH